MSDRTAATPSETPITATAQTARDEIAKLKAKATETLREEFQAIAEAAKTEDVDLRLKRHSTRIEVAWNPYTRRFEPIYPESEGYDEAERIEMTWCPAAGRYVTIPN